MTQYGRKGAIVYLTVLAFSWCLITSPASADTASYHYDSIGRLSRVVKGTQGTIYRYDELGNVLSVASATTTSAAPVLSSINPNFLFVGSTLYVKIVGQNLLTTESVTSNNPALSIGNLFVTDNEITAEMRADSAGSATVTVTTAYGSSGIGVTLSNSTLKLSPSQLAIVPGSSGTLTASIDPPLSAPLTINLDSSNASASVPATATIPVSGTAYITVNGLAAGIATISVGSSRSVVFVSSPFAGDVSGLTGGTVSVYIEDPISDPSTSKANSVSVIVNASSSAQTTGLAAPVSVYLEDSSIEPVTAPSLPVSVQIQP